MRKPAVLSLAVGALLALPVAVPPAYAAPPTSASIQTTFDQLDPQRLLTVAVQVASPDGVKEVRGLLNDRSQNGYYDTVPFTRTAGTAEDGTWTLTYHLDAEQHPGSGAVIVEMVSGTGEISRRVAPFTNCYRTQFTEMAADPGVMDYDTPVVHASGRLLLQRSRDVAPEPVPAGTAIMGLTKPVATDGDGRFAVDLNRVPSASASVPSSNERLCGSSAWVPYRTVRQEILLEARQTSPSPTPAGGEITIEGTVRRRSASGLVPDGGQKVAVGMIVSGGNKYYNAESAADGTFRVTFPVAKGGSWNAWSPETDFTEASNVVRGEPDQRTGTPVFSGIKAGSPVERNGLVGITGRLTRSENGTPAPIGRTTLDIEFSPDGKTGWTKVSDSGWVSDDGEVSSFEYATRDGYWRLRYRGDTTTKPGYSPAVYVDVRTDTYFYDFNAAPEPVRKGGTLTVSGKLYRRPGDDWTPFPSGAKVAIQFRADGATTWTTMGTTTTGKNGVFRKQFTASKKGAWRATYAGDATYMPRTSDADNVEVGIRTLFTSAFNASPEPVRAGASLKVAGKLVRFINNNWVHAGSGAVIQIQFKASGSSTWTTLGTTKTTSAGTFARTFKAVKDGTWRAVYTGNSTYLPSTGPTDYVDVR